MALLTGQDERIDMDAAAVHSSGDDLATVAGPGSLSCVECGFAVPLEAVEAVPTCPGCGGSRFKRARLFDTDTNDVAVVEVAETAPEWLSAARSSVRGKGPHLAYSDGGETTLLPLEEGWIRIGRSGAADIRFDDATVSRRHALVVRTEEGELRALDDRSLNGLFVNGERVEWTALEDGDELEIGRFKIYVLTG